MCRSFQSRIPHLHCTVSGSASVGTCWPARTTPPQSHFLSAGEKHVELFSSKLTLISFIHTSKKCIYSTLMTPLMLLMVELSSELTLSSLLTLSAYRRHMKMMYAGSPGMKLTATPRGFRSDKGQERNEFLNVCRENFQKSIYVFNIPVTKALRTRPSSPSLYSSMPQ